MEIAPTAIPAVLRIVPRRHGDARGFFAETWSARAFEAAGIVLDWVQDNHSLSAAAGTLRGLHYQAPPSAQAKLVRCGRGALLDVAVDARAGSPTFGRWVAERLTAGNGAQLLVPEGFLHGFVTLEPGTEIVYKCSAPYDAAADGAVRWDDPDLAIGWGAAADPVLSEKDRRAPRWAEWESPFRYEGPLPWE
ncbi:dTDP-4-dehydrorhamnose 3,5-epimerase [Hasllibacter halocynthiae]|uniref:dTDP-4-dehydrorhamnose 3,5-epimerase n=1 Tax=Hasllibacter halocynthiae TaxID=595589 RepID=A0A2T0X2X3_9RHOB|nr:dTDP-4-dehydrorhamnose 3,5-epimerase [Hasllibacter halocynthiae]PRY93303.1 dTDP-4-dehydrorhamnose 3,5-epimerase [Hasllibacter halocynthiae]